MADSRHFWKCSLIAVTWPKIESFKIQDGGDSRLENRFFGRKSSTDCPISAKFCVSKQNCMPTKATWKNCKFLKSKMADGRHFQNRFIAIAQWKILRYQILNPITVTWQKLKFLTFEMATAAILKIDFVAITHQPIYCHAHCLPRCTNQRNFAPGSRTACRQRPHDKNCKFSKSKMADGRHFENR